MTANRILWSLFTAIFVAPPLLYLTINGYWWLFDGNQLIGDKMFASAITLIITGYIAGTWAALGNVLR